MGEEKANLLKDVFVMHHEICIDWIDQALYFQREELLGINTDSETLKSDIMKTQISVECLTELKDFIKGIKETYNAKQN